MHSLPGKAQTPQYRSRRPLESASGLLCDPLDCSPPGSSVHGIFQARILEWVAIPSPGDLPYPGIKLGLLHGKQILYQLSYEGSPVMLGHSAMLDSLQPH